MKHGVHIHILMLTPLSIQSNVHALKSVLVNLSPMRFAHGTEIVLRFVRQQDWDVCRLMTMVMVLIRRSLKKVSAVFYHKSPRYRIGFAIVKTIVQAHGGRIEVTTQHQGGTVFYLYFPACNKSGLTRKEGQDDVPMY